MTHFPHGAFIAAHQQRERQRQEEIEEEEMTRYSPEELEGNWEFKIVRSETGAFRKPEVFQALLEEESIGGWEMVEKLDNRRVRFKRRKESRRRDATLPPGYDPYRTNYGNSVARTTVIIGVAIALALAAGLGVLGFFSGGDSFRPIVTMIPLVMVALVFVLVIALAIWRRR